MARDLSRAAANSRRLSALLVLCVDLARLLRLNLGPAPAPRDAPVPKAIYRGSITTEEPIFLGIALPHSPACKA